MLQKKFNRVSSVIIGDTGTQLEISDLRVSFDITKTETSESNKGKVQIYNLSESTRNKINELDQKITIKAGYKDGAGLEVLSIGNITLINHLHDSPEIITKIEFADGQKILRESNLSLSYKEGYSLKQILIDIANKLAVPQKLDLTTLNFQDKKFAGGFSCIGQVSNILDKLTKSVGLQWSFQNNELKIQPENKGDYSRYIVIDEGSGLIGSPERVANIEGKSKASSAIPGWEVFTLLEPFAEPGGLAEITSREIQKSIFKIKEVQHVGDTHGDSWITKLTLVEQK